MAKAKMTIKQAMCFGYLIHMVDASLYLKAKWGHKVTHIDMCIAEWLKKRFDMTSKEAADFTARLTESKWVEQYLKKITPVKDS